MYKATYNKNGTLKHSSECKMMFGRKDTECPRCVEMINGSPARTSYHKDYYAAQQRRSDNIKNHNCEASNCGLVCTFGDW